MDLGDVDALRQALSELKLRIDRETGDVIEQSMATPPPEHEAPTAPDPSEDLELVNRLWVLKAGFQEASTLVDREEMEAASRSLERLVARVEQFATDFPHTLLSIDMARQVGELRTRVRDLVAQHWANLVEVTDKRLRFGYDEKGDEVVALFPRSDAAIVSIGHLIDRVLDLNVGEVRQDDGLEFVEGQLSSLDAFVATLKTVTSYLTTAPPAELVKAIVRRYKAHLINGILHRSLPLLYPEDMSALPAFKQQLAGLIELEAELKRQSWIETSELSRFVAQFDEHWPTVRRGQFLARLRQLYKDAAPLATVEARRKLVKPPREEPVDEWEWNDDDGGDEEESDAGDGAAVELWRQYAGELELEEPEQFFTLYRALVPTVYGDRSLWLYADTMAFAQHAGDRAQDALLPFAHLYLHNYVRRQSALLETELLVPLFGNKQNKALADLKARIGAIAEESNAEGGPELREMVLGQLVEQVAVYVVSSIEARDDIGEEESSKLASMIAKLDGLAVFFKDVHLAVPSWYKLEMLGRVLIGNLATIQEMHEQHALADFSAKELDGLLRVLFIDSSARQALIRTIYAAENR